MKRNIAVEDKNIIATITASKEGKFPSDVVAINCDIMVYSILFYVVKGESSTLRIINDGGSASDVFRLISLVREEVKLRFGVTLEEEVIYFGDFER